MQKSVQIRAVFGQNLTELSKNERSMADLSRKLGLSRTQLSRFQSGDAFPRPDVLQVICDHFGVDARILTTPLAQLREAPPKAKNAGLDDYFDPVFVAVSHDVLPDGLYSEWKTSIALPGKISHHLMRIYTKNGQRYLRLKARSTEQVAHTAFRYAPPLNVFNGQIFSQRAGFATIDRTASQRVIALTSFRVGYGVHEDLFPGYKLAGASYNQLLVHSHGPVLLQRLKDTKAILDAARLPQYRLTEAAPSLIQKILMELATEGYSHSGLPQLTPGVWLGGHSGQ